MEYRRFNDNVIIRIDAGEEILTQLKAVAEKEKITAAEVSALGAVNAFTVGVYDTVNKQYYSNSFTGPFEIVSLTGTITAKEGMCYPHIHMSGRS